MSTHAPHDDDIAPRYLRVAALVGKGLTYKQIASRLDLSANTVHYYVHQLAEEIARPEELRELPAKSRVMVWWLREHATRSSPSDGGRPDRRKTSGGGSLGGGSHDGQGRSRSQTAR